MLILTLGGSGPLVGASTTTVSGGKLAGEGQAGDCAPLAGSTTEVCFPGDPYDPGQCTWYASGVRPDLHAGGVYGDAYQWWDRAQGRFPTGHVPVVGAIAVWAPWTGGAFGAGHVAYVAAVSADLKTITVNEANYGDPLHVEYGRRISASTVEGFIYGGPAGNGPGSTAITTPPQTGPIGDLGFIKLQNTGSGTVEVHLDSLQGGSLRRTGDFTSDFSEGDAGNGVWQLFGYVNGAPELGFIKLQNSGSGTVEVHWDTLQGNTYKRAGDYTSDFSPGDATNGSWYLLGSGNGVPVLGFVKVRNTAGTVEAHWDTLQGNTYKRAGDYTSDFSPGDATNGNWQLFGSANGAPELGFIKLQNTGGTVEVHWDTLQGSTYRRVADYTSDFSPADAGNGSWNLYGSSNGAPELGFVKLSNSGSGTVEGHVSALQGSSFTRTADYASDFSPGDGSNGVWQIGYY